MVCGDAIRAAWILARGDDLFAFDLRIAEVSNLLEEKRRVVCDYIRFEIAQAQMQDSVQPDPKRRRVNDVEQEGL